MTTHKDTEAPETISLNPAAAARYPLEDKRIGDVQYRRVEPPAAPDETWLTCANCGNKREGVSAESFVCRHCFATECLSPFAATAKDIYESLPDCQWCGALCPDDAALLLKKIEAALNAAATAMRDECVKKVRALPVDYRDDRRPSLSAESFKNLAITGLESLTL